MNAAEDGVPEVEREQRLRDEQDRERSAYYFLPLKEAAARGDELERVPPPVPVTEPRSSAEPREAKEKISSSATPRVPNEGGVVSSAIVTEAQVIEVPFTEDRRGESEVYAPTVSKAQSKGKLVRYLPPIPEDGSYHHGPECRCGFFCDPSAPEYVPSEAAARTA